MNEKETHILQLFLCYVDKTLTVEQNEELQNCMSSNKFELFGLKFKRVLSQI